MTTQSVTSPRWRPSDRSIKIFTKLLMALLAVVLIVSAIMTVFPFLWSALLSTRDRTEIFGTGISFHKRSHNHSIQIRVKLTKVDKHPSSLWLGSCVVRSIGCTQNGTKMLP